MRSIAGRPLRARFVGWIAVLLMSGCVTTQLTSSGDAVRVTSNPEVVRGCTYIGNATASDRMNGGVAGKDAARENTDRRLRNKAAEMGGDTVHLMSDDYGWSGAAARGEVYRCANDPRPTE